MTDEEMMAIAEHNIDAHLGDVAADYETLEEFEAALAEEVYVLAHDALVDAGVSATAASKIALKISSNYG